MQSDGIPIELIFILSLPLLFLYGSCYLAAVVVSRSHAARLKELGEAGTYGSTAALRIIRRRESFLLALHLGMCLTTLLLGAAVLQSAIVLDTVATLKIMMPSMPGLPIAIIAFASCALLVLLSLHLAAHLIQAIAGEEIERLLCYIAPPMLWLSKLLTPPAILPALAAGRVARAFGVKSSQLIEEEALSAEELSHIIEASSEAGAIEEEEWEMIEGVFSFSDTVVREVMTPRAEVVFVHENAPLQRVVDEFKAHGVSRIIVTGAELDDVKGVVIAKDLIPLAGAPASHFSLQDFLRPAHFVRGDRTTADVFQELRKLGVHLAVAVDEHGGVDGVLSMEDLIEEIVGEIFDEFDKPEDDLDAKRLKSGELLVSGSASIYDLNEQFNYQFPNGDYDTIAGFVIHRLGRMPVVGDTVVFQGTVIHVEDVQQNRVTKLRFSIRT